MCKKQKLVKRYSKTKSFKVNNGSKTYSILNQGKEVVLPYREIPHSKDEVKKELRKIERDERRIENQKRLLLNDLDFLTYGVSN